MTRAELIDAVAKGHDQTKAHTAVMLEAFLGTIQRILAERGEEVVLHGFGKFSVTKTKARTGRNPQNGAPIHVSAKARVKFAAQKALRDAVNP